MTSSYIHIAHGIINYSVSLAYHGGLINDYYNYITVTLSKGPCFYKNYFGYLISPFSWNIHIIFQYLSGNKKNK